jgi:Glyoxalase-like domain
VTLRFDHAIICVFDLEQAMEDFRALGFNPIIGGQHAGGKTHNALIVFRDGTYLELLAPTSPALLENLDSEDRSSFLFMFAEGEGYRGYALVSDDLESDVKAIQQSGLEIEMTPPNGRARPDGVQLRWRSAFLTDFPGAMTPFLIEDLTPRNLRVPDDPAITTHPNGASGIWELTIKTSRTSDETDFHSQLLQQAPLPAFFDPPVVRQAWAYHNLTDGTRLMICTETSDGKPAVPRRLTGLGLITEQIEGGTLEGHGAAILLSPRPFVERLTRRSRP